MSIKSIIVDGVNTAFDILESLEPTTATYKSSGTYQYNPITKINVESDGTSHSFTGILVNYEYDEIDGEAITRNDYQYLLKGSEVTAASVNPKVDDLMEINSVDYFIISIDKDPADALWVLQLRPDKR